MFKRIHQSFKNRGLTGTVQSGLGMLEDFFFDIRNGTDTWRRVGLENNTIVDDRKSEANPYHPTRGRAFRKVMSQLSLPSDSVFVDLGSGKGKTLLLASRMGFKRIVGVEFLPELCAIAEKNVKAWSRRYGQMEFQIVRCDAGDYQMQDDENVFFMFNPFGEATMRRVIRNITLSLNRHPRKAWMIYADPDTRAVIEQITEVREVLSCSYGGFDFVVWEMCGPLLS